MDESSSNICSNIITQTYCFCVMMMLLLMLLLLGAMKTVCGEMPFKHGDHPQPAGLFPSGVSCDLTSYGRTS